MDAHAEAGELVLRLPAELVVAQRRVELGAASEPGELDGRDGPSAAGLLPPLDRVGDVAARRRPLDPDELAPLDVADDGEPHARAAKRRHSPGRPSLVVYRVSGATVGVSHLDGRPRWTA